MTDTETLRKMLLMSKPTLQIPKSDLLGTGSTLLNLACSGDVAGGFGKGEYIFLVGDSMSGKTWLSMTCLAEAARRKSFKDYQFILDNPEQGSKMDIDYFFGKRVADRLSAPPLLGISTTVEDFYINVNGAIDKGPCIYILDSMDCLDSQDDVEQFEKIKKARIEGKETTGSYGTGKAKTNSQGLRQVTSRLQESGSILIVISQTRDNIGFGAQFNPKTRSGGKALRFYAQLEIWTSVIKTLKKKVKGKDRQQGVITCCEIKKNRHTGQQHKVTMPLYHSFGIDDVQSCIDYLVEEGHWSKSGSTVNAPDLEFKGTEAKLIEHIEDNDMEAVLIEIVGEVWAEIQKAVALQDRKKRYQ